jgi:sterol desaturase/sphingolipid hydroxylase (fatty acid hydroxylase superfamily)
MLPSEVAKMSAMQSIVRYGYAPFMMLGLTGAAYWVMTSGHSYLWLVPILLTAFATAFAAEKIAPFFDEWNDHDDHGDGHANFWHTVIYELSAFNGVMLIPIIQWLFPVPHIWPTDWPLWAQVLLAFLIADFAFWAMHYLSHRKPVLWRLHAVHHGVSRLYGFNGVIRHPLHQSLDMIVAQAPLVMLGMTQDVAIMLGMLITVTLIVQHSNVAQALGPFENHLSIGRVHHLHHVNWGTEGDCNFGLLLTLWDKLAGTFVAKPSRAITSKDMGVDELPNFPKSFIEQMLLPFYYEPGKGEPARYRKQTPAQEARSLDEKLHPAE